MATTYKTPNFTAQQQYFNNFEQILTFVALFSKHEILENNSGFHTQMFSGLLSDAIIGKGTRDDLRRVNKNIGQFNTLLARNIDKDGKLRIKHELDESSIDAMKEAIEESGEKVSESFVEKFKSFLPNIGTIQKWTTPAAIILGTIALIRFYHGKPMCRTSIYIIIALFIPETLSFIKPYIFDLMKSLVDVVKETSEVNDEENTENSEPFRTQMSIGCELSQDNVWTIASALAGIVLAWAVRDATLVKSVVKTIINLKDFERVRGGVMGFIEFLIEILERIINSIRNYFGRDSMFFLKNGYSEVYDLYNEVEKILSEAKTQENLSTITIDKALLLENLVNQADKNILTSNRRESKLVNQMKNLLKPLIERIKKLNRGKSGSRIAPTTIMLIGESQIGKSVASMQFIKGIIAATLPDSRLPGFTANPDSEIYSKPESSPYWEGFNDQWAQVYDDIGHMQTMVGKESVESDMISIKNSVPMPLNMAFGDKGSKYYSSRLVIASSNTEYWDPKNLTYKDAFINRWDFVYITAVKADPKYCINPEEKHPMRRMLKPNIKFDNSQNTPHLEYIKFDFKKRHQVGPKNKNQACSFEDCCNGSYTMEEVIEEVTQFHKDAEIKYEEIIATHERIINEQLALKKGKCKEGYESDYDGSSYYETQGKKNSKVEYDTGLETISMDSVQLVTNELLHYNESQGDGFTFRLSDLREGDFVPHKNVFHKHMKLCNALRLNCKMYKEDDVHKYIDLIDRAPISSVFTICPVMDSKPESIVVPARAAINEKSKYDFIMGAITANVIDIEDAKGVIKKFDDECKGYYPTSCNTEFIDYCRESKIEWQCIGLFIHCVARVKVDYNRCYAIYIKKKVKNTIYSAVGIIKSNLKALMSTDWIMSMGSALFKGIGTVALVFGSIGAVMQIVKHTIGMNNFVSKTGLPDYNMALMKDSLDVLSKPQKEAVQSTNLSVVKNFQKSRNTARHKVMTSQFAQDSTMHDMVDSFIKRNCYLIYFDNDIHGTMWIIAERVGLMPKHYRSFFEQQIKRGRLTKENPLYLRPWETNKEEPYAWYPHEDQFSMPLDQWKTSDIIAVKFDKSFQPRPNRTSFFISEKDVDNIVAEQKTGRVTVVEKPGQKQIRDLPIKLIDGKKKSVVGGFDTPYFWAYEGYTKHGDCGAVLSVHDRAKSTPGKIMGMHIAGNGTSSLAMPVMKEDLEELLQLLKVKYTTEEDERTCYDTQGKKNRSPHPALWSEEQIPMPRESKICRSPLYAAVELPTKIPAKLSNWKRGEEWVDPIAIALAKQIPKSVIINEKLVDIITHEYYKFIMETAIVKRSGTGKIFSVEEACAGIKGDPYIKGIPRKTSAGHPYNLLAKNHGGGKKLWFGTKEDYDLSGEFFQKFKMRVEGIIESAKHGRRMNHVTLDFPKDETLPTKKVEEDGKVRLVMGSPMDHTVTGRCLTLEFMKFMLQNAIHNWSGVGIDPHDSSQWGLIAEKLRGGHIIEADQSAYDGRMQPIFGQAWTNLCNMWYNDEHRLAREIIDLDLFFSKHIMDGVVTERRGTHSSGNYATVWANTVSNIITTIYAIVLVMRGTDDVDDARVVRTFVATIFRKCDAIFVGDDFLFSIPDDMKEMINFHTLKDGMEMIGYKITSPHKDERANNNFVKFKDATFLKRKFRQTEFGEWYAPLEMESIVNQINWVNKKNFARKDFILTIESYCHELSLHGEDEFDWRFNKLKDACIINFDYVPKYSSCEEYFVDRRNALLLLDETEDVDLVIQKFGGQLQSLPKTKKKIKEEETARYCKLVKAFEEECLVTSTSLYGSPMVEIRDADYNVVSPTKKQKKQKSHSDSGGDVVPPETTEKTRESCERPKSCKGKLKQYHTQMATTHDTSKTTLQKQHEDTSVSIEQGTTNLNISTQEGFIPEKEYTPVNLTNKSISQDHISDFFKKKVEVSTVPWSTTVGTMTVLDTIYISNQLFSQSIWANKLSGYLNFRATAVLTVQINATPFHQGALYLVWKPYVDNDNDFGIYDQMHASHMINLSQLPGHIMTVSSDSIEIRIPYVGPVEYIRRDNADRWNWGALGIYVYSPLKAATSDSVIVKTWLSFDDIKIETPYYTQMNVSRVKGQTASESEDVGPVSGTMKTLKRIVDNQEARVLEMVSLCMPPTWLLEDGSKNAKAMGWSKPNNSGELTRMVRNLYFFGPNSDGPDVSQSMSLRADNKVQLLPSMGAFSGDEMCIDYIISKWSYLSTFNFTTSNASGDGLYNIQHNPSALFASTEIATGPASSKTIYNMTPSCFMSQMFEQWRGDLEFKFVFVKTGFHSGAISVTYLPGKDTTSFSYASAPYNLRTVMDLQEAEEFCFRVPYSVPDPWLPFLTKAGHIHVHCVTPLKAPTTVSQNIEVLVYVRAADNVSFQVPRYECPKATYYTQGADISNDGCVEEDVLGNGSSSGIDNSFEALCVGEKITSLKQLLLRMEKVGVTSSASGIFQSKIKTNSTNVFAWQKSGIPAYYSRVAPVNLNCTILDTIMCCYLFQRGSTRWAVYCANNFFYSTLKAPIDWGSSTADFRTDRWLSSTSHVSNSGPSIYASEHVTGGIIVRAPFYHKYPMAMIRPTWINTQTPTGRWDTNHYINIETQNSWNVADNSTTFTRSVGDDYQLGFFIGIPTLSFN